MRLTVATSPPSARSSSPAPTSTDAPGDGSTPLLWAAHRSDLEIARALIAAGAAVDARQRLRRHSRCCDASRTGDAAMVELLLRPAPIRRAPIRRARRRCWPPRVPAAFPLLRLLLARGVDVNAAEKLSEDHGADVGRCGRPHRRRRCAARGRRGPNRQAHVTSLTNAQNADHPTGGFTALMWAARNGNDDDGATARRRAAPT